MKKKILVVVIATFSCYRAVDGHLQTNLESTYGCTHTEDDLTTPTPWWLVDLQGFYYISNVTITNRGDCCGECLFSVLWTIQFYMNAILHPEIHSTKMLIQLKYGINIAEANYLIKIQTFTLQISSDYWVNIYSSHQSHFVSAHRRLRQNC